nr:major latex allergen Hev b 5-like [Arachis hypogaea]
MGYSGGEENLCSFPYQRVDDEVTTKDRPPRKKKTSEPTSATAEPSAPPSGPAPYIVAKFDGRDPGPPPLDTLKPEAKEPASEEPTAEAGQAVQTPEQRPKEHRAEEPRVEEPAAGAELIVEMAVATAI